MVNVALSHSRDRLIIELSKLLQFVLDFKLDLGEGLRALLEGRLSIVKDDLSAFFPHVKAFQERQPLDLAD